jgi:hypothetical protein
MGKRSLRALHWVEAKHPRDDRGRFSHKGGQKWARKVADELGARFGDIHMGAAPGREPQGKLQSSKAGGFLLNTKAASAAGRDAGMRAEGHRLVTELGGIRKERGTGGGSPEGMREALNNSSGGSLKATVAQLRTHVQQEGGWLKEERAASAGTISVGDLKKGDHAKLVGQDAYGKQISLDGYVQGVGDVNVRKGRNRTPMKAVQVAETPSGAGGWRGTVYVKPDHMAEKTTPKADVARLEGRRPGGTVQVVNPDGKGGFKVEGRITREEAARQMGLDKPVGGRKPGGVTTTTPKAPETPQNRRMAEVTRIENARASFGKGEASKATEMGRKPGGGYQYSDYSKAHHDMGNLTVAEAGLPDKGAVHSQYQGMLRSINELKRQGPARVGSKDQYYRPMTRKLEEAAQYVHEHEGNPDTVAKLRALADIHRPHTDTAPKLVSGADIRSQRAAMASSLGVDMNDPNRWTRSLGDVRQEVINKAIRDIPQHYTHKDLMDARQRLKDISIHDTEAMDAAALNLHRIGDEIRAKQDDLKAAGTRFRTALEAAGGLADQEAAIKADLRRIKKENGIPGDAAIKKLPNGERQAAEAAVFNIQKATRTRVARENNLKQGKIGREVLAKGGMHPDNAAELEKRIKNVEGGATAEQVARDERERDLALAVWRHAKDNSGTTGEYPADHLKGLDNEEQTAVAVMARNVGLNAADELAQDLRGQKGLKAPKANTDYTGFSESQTRALRSIENDPLRHAQVRENFGQANAARAADEAKRAKELATVSAVALPEPSASHADQEAALEALAKQVDPNRFKGGKIFNNHVMEGAYSGSIQDAYGKRVLNYDGRKGTWTTSNGGQLAPNQVHAYIAEYNRHDQFDRDPNYLKSIVDKQVAPEFPAQTGGGTRGGGSVVADLRKISNGSAGSVANDLESGDVTPAEAADRLDRIGRQRGLDGRTRGQLSAAAQRLRAQSREDLGLNRPAPAGAHIETTRTGNIKKPPRTPSSKPGSRTEQVLRDLHAELAKHPVSEQKIAFSDATIREVVGRLADEVAQGKISEDEARNQLDRLLGRAFNYAKSEQSGTHGALKKATDALAAVAGRRPGGKA